MRKIFALAALTLISAGSIASANAYPYYSGDYYKGSSRDYDRDYYKHGHDYDRYDRYDRYDHKRDYRSGDHDYRYSYGHDYDYSRR